mgnify:CR=1 FL=1
MILIVSLVSICNESHTPSKESAACKALFSVYATISTWYVYLTEYGKLTTILAIAVTTFVLCSKNRNKDPFKEYSLPTILQIVTDIGLIDPDDNVMVAALITKLLFSPHRDVVYLRTSPQEKMSNDEYWKTIIEWLQKYCYEVDIPWKINDNGDLVFDFNYDAHFCNFYCCNEH